MTTPAVPSPLSACASCAVSRRTFLSAATLAGVAAALDAALEPWRARGLAIAPVATSLEDVFIALMRQSQDNFGQGVAA